MGSAAGADRWSPALDRGWSRPSREGGLRSRPDRLHRRGYLSLAGLSEQMFVAQQAQDLRTSYDRRGRRRGHPGAHRAEEALPPLRRRAARRGLRRAAREPRRRNRRARRRDAGELLRRAPQPVARAPSTAPPTCWRSRRRRSPIRLGERRGGCRRATRRLGETRFGAPRAPRRPAHPPSRAPSEAQGRGRAHRERRDHVEGPWAREPRGRGPTCVNLGVLSALGGARQRVWPRRPSASRRTWVSDPVAGRFGAVARARPPRSGRPRCGRSMEVADAIRLEIALERATDRIRAVYDEVEDQRAAAIRSPTSPPRRGLDLIRIEASTARAATPRASPSTADGGHDGGACSPPTSASTTSPSRRGRRIRLVCAHRLSAGARPCARRGARRGVAGLDGTIADSPPRRSRARPRASSSD